MSDKEEIGPLYGKLLKERIRYRIYISCSSLLLGSLIYSAIDPRLFNYLGLDFLINISPPFILAISLYLWQQFRYFRLVYLPFDGKIYSSYPKRSREAKRSYDIELYSIQNRIIYRHVKNKTYEGEIILDLFNLRYGKGYHFSHFDAKLDTLNKNDELTTSQIALDDRFGFSQFIIFEDKIRVEHPYHKPDRSLDNKQDYLRKGEVFHQASVWIQKQENE